MTIDSEFRRHVECSILAAARSEPERARLLEHMGLYVVALDMIRPIATPDMRVVDIGSRGSMVPALRQVLGLERLTVTNAPDESAAHDDMLRFFSDSSGEFSIPYDRFDIEETFPYRDGMFDLVILTEVLEHITRDPMHTIGEINRVLRKDGWIVLSTPNCASLRSLLGTFQGRHPYAWAAHSAAGDRDRHNREYTPKEARCLMECGGFAIEKFFTSDAGRDAHRGRARRWLWRGVNIAVSSLTAIGGCYVSPALRGQTIFARAKKAGAVMQRHPDFLYY